MRRLCLLSLYDANGIVHKCVSYLISQLKEVSDELIITINGSMNPSELLKLNEIADKVYIRENNGFDLAGHAFALKKIGEKKLEEFDELLICNDTFFGFFTPIKELLQRYEEMGCDYTSLTDEKNGLWDSAISYFMIFKRKCFDQVSKSLMTYYQKQSNNYLNAVFNGEVKIYRDMKNAHFTYSPLYKIENVSIYLSSYYLLKTYKLPVIKKKSFFSTQSDNSNENSSSELIRTHFLTSQDRTKNIINSLKYVRDNTDYPVEYILEYIATEYKNYISMEMLEAEYSETKIYRAPVSKYSLDEIIQFCRENPEIYIYGNGSYAAKLYLLLQAHLKNFKGFIVSDGQNTNAAVIGGKKVFQWSEIESKTAGILIGLNKDNADEIRETVSGDRVLYLW